MRRGDAGGEGGGKGRPPKLAELILRLSLPFRYRDQQIGDLREAFIKLQESTNRTAARRWYRRQLLRSVVPNLMLSLRLRGHILYNRPDKGQDVLGSVGQDLRFLLRSFAHKPAFFTVVMMLFALGIGANTAIFSVVDAVLLRALPYVEPDRLITTYQTIPDWRESDNPGLRAAWNRLSLSYPVYEDWLEMNDVFDALGIHARKTYVATGGDQPEWITGRSVTHGVFEALGVAPILGRVLVPGDDIVGGPQLVVLSHGLWQRRFGADSGVIGHAMILDEQHYQVIGVMPQGFYFPNASDTEMWTTFSDRDRQRGRTNQFAQGIALLKPEVSLQLAQESMEVIQHRLADLHPHPDTPGRRYGVDLESRKDAVVGDVRAGFLLLFGAVGLVLLISCVNIANLLLIRTSERRRELAVRSSIGAGQWRLLRQLLTESMLLSLMGGALGTALAIVSMGPFVALLPPAIPRLTEVGVDLRLLTFALGLSILTGTLIGLLPACAVFRTSINAVLQGSGRGTSSGRPNNRTQSTLLVFEVALTFVLLVGAGLLTKSFLRLTSVDRGFTTSGVVAMQIDPRGSRYESDESVHAIYQDLDEALGAIPGVSTVGESVVGPFMGGFSNGSVVESTEGEVETNLHVNEVTNSFFEVMEIPMIRGRLFTPDEVADRTMVAVVSAGLERTYWPREGAIGKRIRFGKLHHTDNQWYTVIGVVGDIRRRLDTEPYPTMYRTINYRSRNVLLKTAVPPAVMMAGIREAVRSVDPELPIANLNTLEERVSESVAGQRFAFLLMSCLGGVAATLAVVGIFGVLAYAVTQRTNEIGIRMALGATTTEVVRGVLHRGLVLLGLGIAFGLAVSFYATRALEGLLFEVNPNDLFTMVSVTALLTAAALAASYLPARRAAKVDPVEALRHE